MASYIGRRKFLATLGGAAVAWPLAARAQQPSGRMRRIGVLMNLAPEDAEGQARLAAFLQGLQEAGWAVGRNAQIDIRWAGGNAEQMRRQVTEMVALAPDVILASSPQVVGPLRDATRTIPIVFVAVVDPVASGFVDSTTRPGGNATGFGSADYSTSAKWLELLKEIAPEVARVAVLYHPRNPGGLPMFTAIQVMAPMLRVELSAAAVSRYDETGLIWLLCGREVVALTEATAAIQNQTGNVTTYRRHNKPAFGPLGDSLNDFDPPTAA